MKDRKPLSFGSWAAIVLTAAMVRDWRSTSLRPVVRAAACSLVGFAVGFARGLPVEETFRMALAVSAANALSLFTGDFDPADYKRLYPDVIIKKL